jgi:hypothetical protein
VSTVKNTISRPYTFFAVFQLFLVAADILLWAFHDLVTAGMMAFLTANAVLGVIMMSEIQRVRKYRSRR